VYLYRIWILRTKGCEVRAAADAAVAAVAAVATVAAVAAASALMNYSGQRKEECLAYTLQHKTQK
jgi:hypothetical protein